MTRFLRTLASWSIWLGLRIGFALIYAAWLWGEGVKRVAVRWRRLVFRVRRFFVDRKEEKT